MPTTSESSWTFQAYAQVPGSKKRCCKRDLVISNAPRASVERWDTILQEVASFPALRCCLSIRRGGPDRPTSLDLSLASDNLDLELTIRTQFETARSGSTCWQGLTRIEGLGLFFAPTSQGLGVSICQAAEFVTAILNRACAVNWGSGFL